MTTPTPPPLTLANLLKADTDLAHQERALVTILDEIAAADTGDAINPTPEEIQRIVAGVPRTSRAEQAKQVEADLANVRADRRLLAAARGRLQANEQVDQALALLPELRKAAGELVTALQVVAGVAAKHRHLAAQVEDVYNRFALADAAIDRVGGTHRPAFPFAPDVAAWFRTWQHDFVADKPQRSKLDRWIDTARVLTLIK